MNKIFFQQTYMTNKLSIHRDRVINAHPSKHKKKGRSQGSYHILFARKCADIILAYLLSVRYIEDSCSASSYREIQRKVY